MLFDEPVLYFKGLTIYRDFSDPRTFYFLPPEQPRVARDPVTNDYLLRLVLYRPDPNTPPPAGFENGGGFLNLDVELGVTDAQIEEVEEEISSRFGVQPNLVPVPFIEGGVELVLLGVSSRDEDADEPFVRKVAGSAVPSLYGSQRASFSVVLDKDGAALMSQVLEAGGVTMALAIYHLTYAGIGPAYNLKITIDYERVFEKMDLKIGARVSARNRNNAFVGRAGFHMLMEELKESRAILVEEVDPIPGEGGRDPASQERINEIIGNLMGSTWFKPTLAQAAQITNLGAAASSSTGSGSGSTSTRSTGSGSTTRRTGESDSGTTTRRTGESGSGTTGGASGTTPAGRTGDSDEGERSEADEPARQEATWSGPAADEDDERGVETFVPSTSGTQETLRIRGGEGAEARVDSQVRPLEGDAESGFTLNVDVPAGEHREVVITWPGRERPQPYHLFFQFDRPEPNETTAYQRESPSPPDARFSGESGTEDVRGPISDWLGQLPPGVDLHLNAHASWEDRGDSGEELERRNRHNERLSERRSQVAQALVGGRGFRIFEAAHSHDDSRDNPELIPVLDRDRNTPETDGGKQQHRVVTIETANFPGDSTVVQGVLARPRGTTPPVTPGRPERPGTPTTPPTRRREEDPTKVEASFEIDFEMIEREEKITATYELNSRKARKAEKHPQGQLVLGDIDRDKYIIEADGAIEFFRWLDINATTTAQWEQDGIDSIRIQLRYGPRDDGSFMHTGEIMLTAESDTGSWRVGIERWNDDRDRPAVYWYDHRVTVNFLPDVALGDQQGAVSSVGSPNADAEGWIRDTARNLVINPRDVTPAITLHVTTGVMRFDLLQEAQLTVHYGPHRRNLTLTPEQASHKLVIRPEAGLEEEPVRTEGTLFYKDGARTPIPPQEWTTQELVVVNEPRDNILRVQVILADPGDDYERVRATLRYTHENRVVEEDFELTQHGEIKDWSVRLEDANRRDWEYQATLIKKSGDIDTIDWTPGDPNDRLMLGIPVVDVLPVKVVWLMPPPAADLIAVKIDLRYIDEDNDVHWETSELIREGHTGDFEWSFAIVDEDRRQYEYRVTEFTRSGERTEGEWQPSTEPSLVLIPGG